MASFTIFGIFSISLWNNLVCFSINNVSFYNLSFIFIDLTFFGNHDSFHGSYGVSSTEAPYLI